LPAVVSNDVGCSPDLIEPGRTGLIFPTGKAHLLADRLVEMRLAAQGIDFSDATTEKVSNYSAEFTARAITAAILSIKQVVDRRAGRKSLSNVIRR
jgi:hypothetical protein